MKGLLLMMGAAISALAVHAAVVEVSLVNGNATPAVSAAVARLRDGDTLRFANGEYHFFEEGAKDLFLASAGSSTGMKKAVVHLDGLKDVTVDGGGSRFVFHENTFPFIAERCDGVKICNLLSAFADIIFERNRLRNGNAAIVHDDLTGYWGECGPAHTLIARDNDCENLRGAAFGFAVPFTGRAVLENNRVRGGKATAFGQGVGKTVEVR